VRLVAIKARLRGWPLYGTLQAVYRLAADRVYRRGRRLAHKNPANLFQPFATTREDRYPRIFRFVRDRLGDADHLRLLSFGCATGEEVFTLRRYFAAAAIAGIDIDPANITRFQARLARSSASGLSFAVGSSTEGEDADSYDAIFCMAVLRHGGLAEALPESCALPQARRALDPAPQQFSLLRCRCVGRLRDRAAIACERADAALRAR
jgi:hypothetical protein